MLPECKQHTNEGVGLGMTLVITAGVIGGQEEGLTTVGNGLMSIGGLAFLWGCCQYMKGKGYSQWLVLLMVFGPVGLFILACFPDRHKNFVATAGRGHTPLNRRSSGLAESSDMSLFQWLGETYNPGPVGTVHFGGRSRGHQPRLRVLVSFVLSAQLLGLWAAVVLYVWQVRTAAGLVAVTLATALYLCLGYFVHPKPDKANVGWLGGLLDHPFRFSDNINRFLIFWSGILCLGRFISESLVDIVGLVAHVKQPGSGSQEVEDPGSKT